MKPLTKKDVYKEIDLPCIPDWIKDDVIVVNVILGAIEWLKEEIKAYWIREEHYNHTQGRVDLKNLNMLIDEAFQIQEKGGLNGKDN